MITPETVNYISSLARLHLEEGESVKLAGDLEAILHYAAKLNTLDVSSVTPTSHVLNVENVVREDVVLPGLSPAEAFSFAIEHQDNAYKVPRIIE
ncbi:MAG: Asp-tRNA(Asn)/Glu-tRNA(Gln) amidotransferase subunit GatC [Candidatus Omnitrophota bacterium]